MAVLFPGSIKIKQTWCAQSIEHSVVGRSGTPVTISAIRLLDQTICSTTLANHQGDLIKLIWPLPMLLGTSSKKFGWQAYSTAHVVARLLSHLLGRTVVHHIKQGASGHDKNGIVFVMSVEPGHDALPLSNRINATSESGSLWEAMQALYIISSHSIIAWVPNCVILCSIHSSPRFCWCG